MRDPRQKTRLKTPLMPFITLGVVSIAAAATVALSSGGLEWLEEASSESGGTTNTVPAWSPDESSSASASPSPVESGISATTGPEPQPTPSTAASASTSPASGPDPSRPSPSTVAPSQPAPASGLTAEFAALVNRERAKAGCPAVSVNTKLATMAQSHSDDQAAHQNLSHTGSDGSSAFDRARRVGYAQTWLSEVAAMGGSTPAQIMSVWMEGASHRAQILNCAARDIGAGVGKPGQYWTLVLGTPA
ncbi:CAP domain-containing protein [Streptomyces sp. NPDC047023]|uniref:CAP domain-containing protein n=1 Tax=Streptomyces sp. NPDC047023 TaxID=3155139 RepID=UPI0033E617A0